VPSSHLPRNTVLISFSSMKLTQCVVRIC
jgi:hypothetical protein